jgi:hypothetical protein
METELGRAKREAIAAMRAGADNLRDTAQVFEDEAGWIEWNVPLNEWDDAVATSYLASSLAARAVELHRMAETVRRGLTIAHPNIEA